MVAGTDWPLEKVHLGKSSLCLKTYNSASKLTLSVLEKTHLLILILEDRSRELIVSVVES